MKYYKERDEKFGGFRDTVWSVRPREYGLDGDMLYFYTNAYGWSPMHSLGILEGDNFIEITEQEANEMRFVDSL